MKRINFITFAIVLVLIISLIITLIIKNSPKEQKFEDMGSCKALSGIHELSMIQKNGEYFSFVSNSNGVRVYFSWLSNDNKTYILSSMPIERIRVKFDNNSKKPTIEYSVYVWSKSGLFGDHLDKETNNLEQNTYISDVEKYTAYAVIICKESDYPKEISNPAVNK